MEHPKEYMERILNLIMKRFDNLEAKLDKMSKLDHYETNPDEEPLDNEDVLHLLKISFRTLQRYKQERILPYSKVKGKSYYKKSDVLRILKNK